MIFNIQDVLIKDGSDFNDSIAQVITKINSSMSVRLLEANHHRSHESWPPIADADPHFKTN